MNEFISQYFIRIDGSDVSQSIMENVVEITVDTSLYLPAMFTILLHDARLDVIDSNMFAIGKLVEIKAATSIKVHNSEKTLIKGEITSLEPNFSSAGMTTFLIRGYTKAHRLHRGKKSRTFANQTDSQIVQTIAGEVGLSAQVDTTSVRYEYVLQNNQTNMEFLQARARRLGYKVFVDGDTLHFRQGDASTGEGPQLDFGGQLREFRPRVSTAHQSDKITVRSWDPIEKAAIQSQATPNTALTQGGDFRTGGATASKAFGPAEMIVVDQPLFSVDEAKALATGLANDISAEFIQAEGECYGDPQISAGKTIKLTGLGTRFSGKYFVTAATHIFNDEGYVVNFTISVRQPNLVSDMLDEQAGDDLSHGLIRGVVPAVVTNLNDPKGLGRVKVKFPWLGDEVESTWVRVVAPMGGGGRGFMYIPEVEDEVLIAFEHGDPHRPYLIGGLWNNKDKPPKGNSAIAPNGKVDERLIQSRSGHLISFSDKDGAESITIRDKTGKNEIAIDSVKNEMNLKVAGDFTIEADGKITLKSKLDMILESQANGSFKTNANLTAEAKGNGTFKGLQLALEGTARGSLKAPTVSVEGTAMAELKAALVKIN